jgi:hypothetical protein
MTQWNVSLLAFRVARRALGFLGLVGVVASGIAEVDAKVLEERAQLESRVQAVRESLQKDRVTDQDRGAPSNLAQWGNWPNWGNWGNWPNWNNWGNWFNR